MLGIGNPGRGDDGIGPRLVELLDRIALPGVDLDANYQLVIEDAAAIASHTAVVLVDADVSGPAPFWFDRIQPETGISFSSHSMTAGAVVHAAEHLFHSRAKVYGLGIRGYEFGSFADGLSPQAESNLGAALPFLQARLQKRDFDARIRPRT